jgi:Predicted metal-binding, possibly nucleic acid-binding protein
MKLNLKDIIEISGASLPFQCELESLNPDYPSIVRFNAPPYAEGIVKNAAGALNLHADITADMVCICDRCMKEFETVKTLQLEVPLAAELEDEENADIFLLDSDFLNLDEVLETCFILDMESKFLCKEDCAGLCGNCGADLNDGPCSCKKKVDPRLAALAQLLDIDEE